MIRFNPHTRAGGLVIELVDELMRLHGRWMSLARNLSNGTQIHSMTSGLVLASVVCAVEPPTVARIARSLGYSRQAIQRVADELERLGYIRYQDNPHHKRAKLLLASEEGLAAYNRSNDASVEWADKMGTTLGEGDLFQTVATLRRVRRYMEQSVKNADSPDTPE
ncbi:MAG: MarR family transcriptional regulator [Rhodocyclaceae bacterium]|jgi:DNA-binding MarR family transcriptional regulator|nr:MarR family transcriptional regulator [Rhodocyclaceae bacterium]